MNFKKSLILLLALCLLFALAGCSGSSTQAEEAAAEEAESEDALVEYAVEGVGLFRLPQGFSQNARELTQPLPSTMVEFEKDGWYIMANRFGTDAYEAAGVALPADLEEYSTRSGVQDGVPEGSVFDYDSQGNYVTEFANEDGTITYYVLLQGPESFGSILLTAPEDVFDSDTAALWASGSKLD